MCGWASRWPQYSSQRRSGFAVTATTPERCLSRSICTTLVPGSRPCMRSVESYLAVRRSQQDLEIDLTGEWRALDLEQIDAALAGVDLANARRISIRTKELTALDLSGAWR